MFDSVKSSEFIAFLLAVLLGSVYVLPVGAAPMDFSFTGEFVDDEDVQLFDFSLAAQSDVTLRTWSYAGGVNAAGETILTGGFDPIVALFDSTGLLIDENEDGVGVDTDPATQRAFDSLLMTTLGAGDYRVALTQYSNFAVGPFLTDGFQGSGTFGFQDVTGDFRASTWALDILNVDAANLLLPKPIPEPGVFALLLLGVCSLLRSQRQKSG